MQMVANVAARNGSGSCALSSLKYATPELLPDIVLTIALLQTNKKFTQITIQIDNAQLHLLPNFIDIPPTKDLHIWTPQNQLWLHAKWHELPFTIHPSAWSLLIHCLDTLNCMGFPCTLQMLDEQRGIDCGPSEWNYVDLCPFFPLHTYGVQFMVITYAEVSSMYLMCVAQTLTPILHRTECH